MINRYVHIVFQRITFVKKKDITLHQMRLQIDDRNKESLEFAGRFSSIIPKKRYVQKRIAFVSAFQKN